MKTPVRIVIADDHPVFRRGLCEVIDAETDIVVVAEAGDGKHAIECVRDASPHVAILDIGMPDMSGLEIAAAIRQLALPVELMFLTVYREESLLNRALDLGAKGYVLKDCAATDIVASIRTVAAGKYYASPELTTELVERSRRLDGERREHGIPELTPTEMRVLGLVAEYRTSKEIAEVLGVSRRTVETHRANICQKARVTGSHALLRYALEHKRLLPPSGSSASADR